jgi:hypothetical protein
MFASSLLRALSVMLLLSTVVPIRSSAGSSNVNRSSDTAGRMQITSAEDFDWRDMLPYLYEAAALPPEQGLKAVLENSRVLRAYLADDVQAHCTARVQRCGTGLDDSALQAEVTREIDAIVQEDLFSKHHVVRVDYPLTRRPFPFTDIVALKTTQHRDAYLVLDFADDSYTAVQVQAKYGAPDDTTVFQWFSMYKYRLETNSYMAKVAFTINPVDGEVHRVAISLKRKDAKK